MKKTSVNLIPDIVNPSPDYYCTWQTQLYATNGGKPEEQRAVIGEKALFGSEKPYGWAYFYEQARKDLFIVMDDSWDVPLNNDPAYYGNLTLSGDKFPRFTKGTANGLKPLNEKIKSLGWKGLGGWVCAQESPLDTESKSSKEYWIKRLEAMNEAGMSYWKVDWGNKANSFEFRKMLTDLARIHAPNLIIEHAMVKDMIPYCDAFRTYDVPAVMSIPMTLQKIVECGSVSEAVGENKGLINCEDEAYIAAAGGYAMGIMRHCYTGRFPNGKADMSFPEIHRNLKTKTYEVIRAARWHRVAPAFSGGNISVSKTSLCDSWKFENANEEIENWWFNNPLVSDYIKDGVLTKSAPAIIARNASLPQIEPDLNGNLPYLVTSFNPNGIYSIATLGRTVSRRYFIPECDVTVKTASAHTIGIFGEYKSLTIVTELKFNSVLMQDIAGDVSFDVTEHIKVSGNKLTVPGSLISNIGTMSQPDNDTSEPGVVLRLTI